MKVSEFLGKRVLDKNAIEIGKVSDMEIEPLESSIKSVTISKGDLSLKQKTFVVSIDEVSTVGDYVIITLSEEELEGTLESSQEEEPVMVSLNKSK